MQKQECGGRTTTRAHLAEAVYRAVGVSRLEAASLVDQAFDEILAAVVRGENVKLSSFGTFLVRHKGQRIGRNPKTKVEAVVSARRVVTFRPSDSLKAAVNRKGGD